MTTPDSGRSPNVTAAESSATLCRICHGPISRPGAECPHCRSRRSLPVLPPVFVLAAVFLGMAILLTVTALLTRQYRAERGMRRSLHLQAASVAAHNDQYEVAIKEFRDALEYDREDLSARLGLAQTLFSLERFSEAWNYLIDLRVTEPTHAVVNRLLGDIARIEGRSNEAASYYRAAIYGRWPEDAEANRLDTRLALIDLLGSEEDYLQELSELAELLEEMPEDIPTRRRIGRLLIEAGAPAKAVRVFQDVVGERADDAEAWVGLGEAEFERGHYLSARTAFTRSRLIDSMGAEAQRWLELCNEIIDLDPTYRRAGTRERHRRSELLLRRALAEAATCVETSPSDADDTGRSRERLAFLVEQAGKVVGRKVPAGKIEESVEENVSLAEGLWEERQRTCDGLPPADEPLGHVLEKLAQ